VPNASPATSCSQEQYEVQKLKQRLAGTTRPGSPLHYVISPGETLFCTPQLGRLRQMDYTIASFDSDSMLDEEAINMDSYAAGGVVQAHEPATSPDEPGIADNMFTAGMAAGSPLAQPRTLRLPFSQQPLHPRSRPEPTGLSIKRSRHQHQGIAPAPHHAGYHVNTLRGPSLQHCQSDRDHQKPAKLDPSPFEGYALPGYKQALRPRQSRLTSALGPVRKARSGVFKMRRAR
jgi:hypothetical protein